MSETRKEALFTARLLGSGRVQDITGESARLICKEYLALHAEWCAALEAEKRVAKDNADLRDQVRKMALRRGGRR